MGFKSPNTDVLTHPLHKTKYVTLNKYVNKNKQTNKKMPTKVDVIIGT
ncbi:unnamed protein product [marine sediment metagenome]|uniref:Uncharacterized protein n=1 Tax=marine sediment metagenome TaxID=412755 RepID=X1DUS0_9ZZZZ